MHSPHDWEIYSNACAPAKLDRRTARPYSPTADRTLRLGSWRVGKSEHHRFRLHLYPSSSPRVAALEHVAVADSPRTALPTRVRHLAWSQPRHGALHPALRRSWPRRAAIAARISRRSFSGRTRIESMTSHLFDSNSTCSIDVRHLFDRLNAFKPISPNE